MVDTHKTHPTGASGRIHDHLIEQSVRIVNTTDFAASVPAVVSTWVPMNARGMDPRVRNKIESSVRDCVQRTGPTTVDAAHRMLRHSFGLSEWALTTLGTVDDETVYHPDNVALYVAEVAAQVSVAHQRDVLWILGQIGRVVAARFWPRARLTLPKTGPALPYNLNEEEAFRLAATLRREPVRAASSAVVSLTLGAGLLARDVQRVVVDDVVDMGAGRLAVWVSRNDQNARLVPVRSDYTDLLNETIEDSCGQRFITQTGKNAASGVARRIEVDGFGHFYLTRARSTWLQAHLLAGTPLAALRVIAGPLSLDTLTQLLGVAAQNVDPEDAARQGLKP